MHATLPLLEQTDFPAIKRGTLETLQVNLGYRCNQQCLHCHVNAGPRRKENMERDTVEELIAVIKAAGIKRLDLTGGAPELNPHFRYLVAEARKLDVHVVDRCNLTILFEAGQEDLAEFLAAHQVEIVASLPCYLKENVDTQRGKGVFDTSLAALRTLNQRGYGKPGTGLLLNLMYNPQGPSLPPAQAGLEQAYRTHLQQDYGIVFSRLYTLTNMPIQRFGSMLVSKGQFADYMQLLRDHFKQENLDGVMCRSLISVDWQGYVYDCDFNQMLGLPAPLGNTAKPHIRDLIGSAIEGTPIVVKDHCYGCTAGQGSSCGGAL
ncbi:radical SAM protein [Candidatus Tenderia electrophaga]|jgi:radical SAM/Cys-rich protein|uniref:Radical SAM protein n=1 Tax=Candidatus Tenderia electrophaga TaxID=1748243 RepID=A0A0S2T9P3_9GAMM|nr:radical SAM protein [Candidatus Tenderia electrophaga]